MRETGLLVLFNSLKSFLFINLLFLSCTVSFSQVYPDYQVDSLLKKGISSIILQDYALAEKTFLNLDTEFPQLPLGKIYLAAVRIAKSYDYGEDYAESYIDSLLNSAKKQSGKLLEKDENNIWNKYFLSISEGYLSYFGALNGDWLNSLSEGVDALNGFDEIIEQDRNFYEAYIAVGTFKYWKSRKTEFLEWLPGYTDEKNEGIDLLEKAVKHFSYNKYLAVNSLIWIYIDQKKFVQAEKTAKTALEEYPGSRFFMWGLARAYEETNPPKSVKVYFEILRSLPGNLNPYNEIVLKHLIARQYQKMGKTREALKLCDDILSINITDESVHSRLKNRLKRVKKLRRELSR
jgi:hypothetical protein